MRALALSFPCGVASEELFRRHQPLRAAEALTLGAKAAQARGGGHGGWASGQLGLARGEPWRSTQGMEGLFQHMPTLEGVKVETMVSWCVRL